MRLLTAEQAAAQLHPDRASHVRVRIDSTGLGNFVDLTNYEGRNWLGAVSYEEGIDNPTMTASFELRREAFGLSLSPMLTFAKPNQASWLSYLPFLAIGRSVIIETATLASDTTPLAADWVNVFEGEIDDLDFGGAASKIRISCRDKGGRLLDAWIENQSVYGSAFPGTAVETVMQQILNAWAPSPVPTLYVPASPSFNLVPYVQEKAPILEALRKISQQFGWDVKYRWDAGTSTWRLTLFDPGRAQVNPDYTIGPSRYTDLSSVKVSKQSIRNYIRIVWTDAVTRVRQITVVQDVNSITKYGKRFMELAEAASSQIDTAAEALALGNAALSDLAEPGIEKSAELPYFFPVETCDYLGFTANGVHYDTDQKLGIVSARHTFEKERSTTVLACRGKPSGAFSRWLAAEARSGVAGSADFGSPGTPGTTLQEPSIGTIAITTDDPRALSPPVFDWAYSECHLDGPYDTAPGGDFTPTAGTLKQIARSTRFEIAGLVPGKWYRIKVVVVDVAGNRSNATLVSQQATERVGPYHTNPDGEFGTLNFNGDFNVYTKGTSFPPDSWSSLVYPWQNAAGRFWFSTTSQQGDKSILANRYLATVAADEDHLFVSDFVPVAPENIYRLDWLFKWLNGSVGAGGLGAWLGAFFYDQNKVQIGGGRTPLSRILPSAAYQFGSGTSAFRTYLAENLWFADRGWVNTIDLATVRYMRLVFQCYYDNAAGAIYQDIYLDTFRVARSMAMLQNPGTGGTARSCATNVWTKPWFSSGIQVDNVGGFTSGVPSIPSEHQYLIRKTGIYTIFGRCSWSTMGSDRSMTARLLKNGNVLITGQPTYLKNMTQYTTEVFWGPDALTKGDIIQLEGMHNDSARTFSTVENATGLWIRQTALADGR
jgi:hypothetical protein